MNATQRRATPEEAWEWAEAITSLEQLIAAIKRGEFAPEARRAKDRRPIRDRRALQG